MSDSATDTERMRRDLEYLRERVDRLGEDLNKQMIGLVEEVHKSRKTDWPAISAVIVGVMSVGGVIGGFVTTAISDRIGLADARLARLETRSDAVHEEIETITREKVNQLKDDFNKKNAR